MAYEKQTWADTASADNSTPITADRLNHMETGIKEAHDAWDSISPVKFNVTMTNVSSGHIIGIKVGKMVYLYSSENIMLTSDMGSWSERQVGTLPKGCLPTE